MSSNIPISPIRISFLTRKDRVSPVGSEESYGDEEFGFEEEEEYGDFEDEDEEEEEERKYEEEEDHWADAADAREVDDLACVILEKLRMKYHTEGEEDNEQAELLDILKVLKDICISGTYTQPRLWVCLLSLFSFLLRLIMLRCVWNAMRVLMVVS